MIEMSQTYNSGPDQTLHLDRASSPKEQAEWAPQGSKFMIVVLPGHMGKLESWSSGFGWPLTGWFCQDLHSTYSTCCPSPARHCVCMEKLPRQIQNAIPCRIFWTPEQGLANNGPKTKNSSSLPIFISSNKDWFLYFQMFGGKRYEEYSWYKKLWSQIVVHK
jgi:hypothetical protein